MGAEDLPGNALSWNGTGDIFDRARREDQEGLAEGKSRGALGGSAGGALTIARNSQWMLGRVVVQQISKLPDKPVFDPFTSPGCFAKEREARLHRWIELKTTDGNTAPHFTPPMLLDKLIENVLQRDAV